jgi:hypothetical protein
MNTSASLYSANGTYIVTAISEGVFHSSASQSAGLTLLKPHRANNNDNVILLKSAGALAVADSHGLALTSSVLTMLVGPPNAVICSLASACGHYVLHVQLYNATSAAVLPCAPPFVSSSSSSTASAGMRVSSRHTSSSFSTSPTAIHHSSSVHTSSSSKHVSSSSSAHRSSSSSSSKKQVSSSSTGVSSLSASLLVNSGFESGNFRGWSLSGAGDVVVSGVVDGFGPQSGTHFALLGAQGSILSQSLLVAAGGLYEPGCVH